MSATRSGKVFSLTPQGDFDFGRLLHRSLKRQEEDDLSDIEDLFSLSPMTSPAPTPPPSPAAASSKLPSPAATSPKPPPQPTLIQPPHPAADAPQASHSKRQGHANRKRKREEKRRQIGPAEHPPRAKTHRKHTEGSTEVASEAAGEDFRIAKTGYVAAREPPSSKLYALDALVGPLSRFKFDMIEWDGRKTVVILDSSRRVIAVLVGRPDKDPSWEAVHASAAEELEKARHLCSFGQKDLDHRRGRFPALAIGISHGGGQLKPQNRANGDNTGVLASLAAHPSFVRLAGFASSAFCHWAPRLHSYYQSTLEALLKHDTSTARPFPNSVWSAATFNFGPNTACFKHRDYANLPFGWCGITSLGQFNPRLGGHLVLWDTKHVLEFPAGSTVLVPSSAIAHSNVPIQPGERRYSFTQYTAGGVFRWVDQGFKTKAQHLASLTAQQRQEEALVLQEQLTMGLGLFSTIDELRAAAPVA